MVRDMIEKNEKVSPNADLLEKLKSLIPGAFAKDGSIDADAIRYWAEQAVGDPQLVTEERETFNFLGKDYARLLYALDTETVIVPDEENNEKPENKNSENLYLSGDNLEVLKHLRRSYEGQIKCIYIDPPYNTGSDDFVYNDSFDFSEKDLEEKLGLDSECIEKIMKMRKRGSHSHAAWLTFMYPRLKLARDLLKDDGVIFISIDDNEQANLKILCDEIFGEENFVGDIIWNSTKSVTNTALISVAHTHNLTYFKNSSYFIENRTDFRLIDDGSGFENPDNDPKGAWKADPYQVGGWRPNQQYEITNPNTGKVYKPAPGCSWKNDKSKFIELWNDGRIIFGKDGKSEPKRKRYIWEAQERGCVSTTLWNDIDTTTNATKYLKTLFDGKTVFSNPKPVSLIHKFLELGCNTKNNEKCIVVDFFRVLEQLRKPYYK